MSRTCLAFGTSDKEPVKKLKWIRLPYLGQFTAGLSKILMTYNFRTVFYNTTSLRHLFPFPEDSSPKFSKSGVYKLNCPDCTSVYIGETSRSLGVRLEEHQTAYNSNLQTKKSTFAEHCLSSGHRCDVWSAELLHKESGYYKRKALEEYEILTHKQLLGDNVLNKVLPESGFVNHFFSN